MDLGGVFGAGVVGAVGLVRGLSVVGVVPLRVLPPCSSGSAACGVRKDLGGVFGAGVVGPVGLSRGLSCWLVGVVLMVWR